MDNFSEIYRKIVFKFNKPKVPIPHQIPINVLSPPKSNPKWESQNLDQNIMCHRPGKCQKTPDLGNDQDEKKAQTNGQCQDPFCILILKGIVKTSKHGGNLIFENFGF